LLLAFGLMGCCLAAGPAGAAEPERFTRHPLAATGSGAASQAVKTPPAPGSPAEGSASLLSGGSLSLRIAVPASESVTLRRIVLQPFTTSTGIAIRLTTVPASAASLPGLLSGPGAPDMLLLDGLALARACHDRLLLRLDWSKPALRDLAARVLPRALGSCGLGMTLSTLVMAWDRDKSPAKPDWADFWDVAKRPGKRGLQRSARGNLELALLADGVAARDVYSTLHSPDGVDRAFRKLDQLKPYVVWWDRANPPTRLLASGKVLLSTAPSTMVSAADQQGHAPFGMVWSGGLTQVESWAIAAASPNGTQALRLLSFITNPARQAAVAALSFAGGLAQGANEYLDPDQQALSPTAPANLAGTLALDDGFWADNGAALEARFRAWLAK